MTTNDSCTGAHTAALRGPTPQPNLYYKVKGHKSVINLFTFELLHVLGCIKIPMTAIYSSTGAQTAALRGPTSQSNLFYKVKSHKNKSFTFELLLFRLYKNTNYSNLLLYRGPDRSSKGPNPHA